MGNTTEGTKNNRSTVAVIRIIDLPLRRMSGATQPGH
jgi:hypothetical protein